MDVELGFITEVENYEVQSVLFPSKVGGRPAWLSQSEIPSLDELKCSNCGNVLRFLLQVYAPRDDKEDCFHRTIYLFCCKNDECYKTNCNISFKVFRNQIPRCNPFFGYDPLLDETPAADIYRKMTELRKQWGYLCDICGYLASRNCLECDRISYCSTDHQTLGWKEGHQYECGALKNAPLEDLLCPRNNGSFNFPEFELLTEPEDPFQDSNSPEAVDQSKELVNNCAKSALGKSEKELLLLKAFEDESRVADKQFQKFKNLLGKDNLQVMRYSYNGQPIWVSTENTPKELDIPRCNCGAKRVFEFQILPQLLLHLNVNSTETSIDWGTLAVYTCADNCSTLNKYLPEFIWKQDFNDQ